MRLNMTRAIIVVGLVAAAVMGAIQGSKGAERESLPGDAVRQQQFTATEDGQEYTIDFRGTVDGR